MEGKTNIFIHINNLICMETKKYYGVKGDKEFPSYMSEFFQAWPEKFEERKNMVKPAFYGLLAVVCVFVVIFPQVIPLLPLWLIRVAGVIGVLFFGIGAWMASSDTYNVESGGKVKSLNIKKFIRNETDTEKTSYVTTFATSPPCPAATTSLCSFMSGRMPSARNSIVC